MGITRRDFLKTMGISVIPLTNMKDIFRKKTDVEFTVYTSNPIKTTKDILNNFRKDISKDIFISTVNNEANSMSKYILNRTIDGIYEEGSAPLWTKISGSFLIAVLEVKETSIKNPGITITSGNKILDPREGSYKSISKKVYSENSATYEIRLKISSIGEKKDMRAGSKAKITVDGNIYSFININSENTIQIPTNLGKMKIVSSKGKVLVKESSCKHKICMHKGYISKSGEKIICAPQKLIITVLGNSPVDSIIA